MIECLSFSSDGSRILVTKLNARDADFPREGYFSDISRTISWVNSKTGNFNGIIRQDFAPGYQGFGWQYWDISRTSAVSNPLNDDVIVINFGSEGLTRYVKSEAGLASQVKNVPYFVDSLALSGSGRRLATFGDHYLTVLDTKNDEIQLHDSLGDPFHPDSPPSIAFNADETRVVSEGYSGLHVFDLATGNQLTRMLVGVEVESFAILPDDTMIVCANSTTKRYDLSGHILELLSASSSYSCSLSPDGKLLATESRGEVRLLDLSTNAKTMEIEVGAFITAITFSPDGQTLAVGDYDGKLTLIDVKTGNTLWTTSPPGRERWPWTYALGFLMLWCLVAVILARRSSKSKPTAASSTAQ